MRLVLQISPTYVAELGEVDQALGVLHLAIVGDAGLGEDEARVVAANKHAGRELDNSLLLVDTGHRADDVERCERVSTKNGALVFCYEPLW